MADKTLKVLHAVWGLGIGGIETMLVNIANSQVDNGADVAILTVNNTIDDSLRRALNPAITLYCADKRGIVNYPSFVRRLNAIIADYNPDVIHLHGSRILGYISSARYRRRCVATLHAMPYGTLSGSGLMKGLMRLFPFLNTEGYGGNVGCMDRVRRVFAISNAVSAALKEGYGIESTVVNNGIIPSRFRRRETFTDSRGFKIVQTSRLDVAKKGQDLLLRAIAQLGDDYSVDFIGDGPGLEELKALSASLGIAERVSFLGRRSPEYVAEHICDYNLLVQPSRVEGFGLTVAEGIAAGVPVLVSRGEGPSEVTCGDTYGWTFTNGDAADLAKKIDYIRRHYDEALAKNERAYSHVLKHYVVDATAAEYLKEYMSLKA